MKTEQDTQNRSILEELRATSQALVAAEEAHLAEAMIEPRPDRRGLLQRLT
jgi:hypothetical protein